MENESDGVEAGEQISESFICCVCLDLLYKPIVLACGHVSCFWCVHRAMSNLHESHCPICRQPYGHFPTICQMLHFLLLKMYPVAYKTRETYMLEEEKEIGCFSPKVDDLLQAITEVQGRFQLWMYHVLHASNYSFRPVVLNCGHVYCEACIVLTGEAIRCQVCQSPHPSGFPKVCLELDHFLEEQFPEEYTARRGTVQLKQVQFQHEKLTDFSWLVHGVYLVLQKKEVFSIGWVKMVQMCILESVADSCGMMPIKGDRYRCIDCKEAIGFDLCGDCYNTRSKVPGRFNQQHTPDHRFEKEKSKTLRKHYVETTERRICRWTSCTFTLC
ncbi:hypothetical protein Vadar_000553 [Vaccinium darrowii]|uniref:Uncharacterized protein n=1 Tax=Vaccinium darrowii TaxID=229202 RepID=A0ACB7Z8S8_9ERIC|nr:hypothetical protein Vadar_000553 [Vaccinium darrowii]